MTRTFTIPRDPWDTGHPVYREDTHTFESGPTALTGCNGSGKSTLLRYVSESLRKEGIPCLSFDNLTEGGQRAADAAGFAGDIRFLATAISSSEGENIRMNLSRFSQKIGKMVRQCRDSGEEELWVLIDAADSGLSIDGVDDLINLLYFICEDAAKSNEAGQGVAVFILAAANSYELVSGLNPYNVEKCEYADFTDYEEYRQFILMQAEREKKERRP